MTQQEYNKLSNEQRLAIINHLIDRVNTLDAKREKAVKMIDDKLAGMVAPREDWEKPYEVKCGKQMD